MGWLIICITLWILISIFRFFSASGDPMPFIFRWFLIFLLGGAFTQFVAYLYLLNQKEYYEYKPLYIESAFTDKNWSVGGAFIIGTGGISGGSFTDYVVYGEFQKGLKRISLNASEIYIRESSGAKPQIKNYWIKVTDPAWDHRLWFGKSKEHIAYHKNYNDLIMIVPRNTIYRTFELK